MFLEGKKTTDKWYPVMLISAADGSALTSKAHSDVTVKFALEAATSLSTYSMAAGLWKESGEGSYWLSIGESEFTAEGKAIVTVAVSGGVTYRMVIEVRDRTIAQTDDDVIAIKAKTDNLPAAPAAVGSAMTLADDAITSAKFDESSAYPLKNADSGSTKVARTGADSDTLETLSDQIDATSTPTTVGNIAIDTGFTLVTAIKRALAILDGNTTPSGSGPYDMAFKNKAGTTETTHSITSAGARTQS